MKLTEDQIRFMRGEIPPSGPRMFLPLLDAGLIETRHGPPCLFQTTPKGEQAIRIALAKAID